MSAHAQAPVNARIKDFNAPTTDDAGRRSIIRGKDAVHVGNRVYQITAPHVDIYRADGALDMIIDAAECFFNNSNTNSAKDVWSDKELAVTTADQRFALKGVGFRWEPAASLLTVSNRVDATIRRQALAATINATNRVSASTNDTLHITADSVERRLDSVTFTGHVHVIDVQGELRCQTLKVFFDEKNAPKEIEAIDDVILTQNQTEARGRRALYSPNSGLLRLYENTSWRMGDRMGESELVILDRTNNTLRAETKVKMTLPSSLLSTNAPDLTTPATKSANTNKLTITADTFDYAPTNVTTRGAIAIFNGDVHANDPQAALDCQLLTILFDQTNRLVRAVADRNVRITRTDGSITGDRAQFENNEISVSGSPRWKLQSKGVGSADFLVFNPKSREVRALKNVRMEIPIASATNLLLSASSTNHTKPATNIVIITATYFTNKDNTATFSENVRVDEPRGQIDANKISLNFGPNNRVDRVVAEGDVILTEQKTQAIGQRADYDVVSGQIRLTGAARLVSEGRLIIAREFLVDRESNQFQPLAPFRIELSRAGTNNNISLFR